MTAEAAAWDEIERLTATGGGWRCFPDLNHNSSDVILGMGLASLSRKLTAAIKKIEVRDLQILQLNGDIGAEQNDAISVIASIKDVAESIWFPEDAKAGRAAILAIIAGEKAPVCTARCDTDTFSGISLTCPIHAGLIPE